MDRLEGDAEVRIYLGSWSEFGRDLTPDSHLAKRVTVTLPGKESIMPLFDFFKKPSKDQSKKNSPETDKELLSPEMQKKR